SHTQDRFHSISFGEEPHSPHQEGLSRTARSGYNPSRQGAVPKWLREQSAKLRCGGSIPPGASTHCTRPPRLRQDGVFSRRTRPPRLRQDGPFTRGLVEPAISINMAGYSIPPVVFNSPFFIPPA